jgi:hypothetical protein
MELALQYITLYTFFGSKLENRFGAYQSIRIRCSAFSHPPPFWWRLSFRSDRAEAFQADTFQSGFFCPEKFRISADDIHFLFFSLISMRYAFNASLISEWIDISTSFVIENQIHKEYGLERQVT